MSFRISGRIFLLAAVVLVYPQVGFANIVGTNMQNFNISANGDDFVTVYSSRTICHQCFGLGFFANYSSNTLPYFQEVEDQTSGIIAGELALGYGLTPRWDVSLSLPFVINQTVGNDEAIHGEFTSNGINEVRLASKLKLLGDDSAGLAVVASVNVNTTDGNPYEGENPKPSYNLEFVGDVTLGKFEFGLNVGYRKKNTDKENALYSEVEPLKDQAIASFATALDIESISSKLVFEVFGSKSLSKTEDLSDRNHDVYEGLLGLKVFGRNNVVYHFGAGREFTHGVASPDLRVYAGLHWTHALGRQKESQAPVIEQVPPPPPPPQSVTVKIDMSKPDEVITVRDIRFQLNSDRLIGANNNQNLNDLAYRLKTSSYQLLLIEGHTCSLGSERYNKNLSQRRADNIRNWLIRTHGLSASKLKATGEGEGKPIASNANESGRALNRRVEFKIYK